MTIKTIVFQVYPDKGYRYRWRLMARNQKITASSGESFATKASAARAVKAVAKSLCADLTKVNIVIHTMETDLTKSKVVAKAAVLW